jgi:hypothetical protein
MKNFYKLLLIIFTLICLSLACSTANINNQKIITTSTSIDTKSENSNENNDVGDQNHEEGQTVEPDEIIEDVDNIEQIGIGEISEEYGYSLSVVSFQDPALNPGIFYDPEDSKKLVSVEFIVGNTSGDTISSNVLYGTIIDSEGFSYGAETGTTENQIELMDVFQGEKVKGWAGFILPENAEPKFFKYSIRGSSSKVFKVELIGEVIDEMTAEYSTIPLNPDFPNLGDVAEKSGYSISAVNLQDPAENPGYFYESSEGFKLIGVEFIVGNINGETVSSNVLYAALVDSRGFVFGAETGSIENQIDLIDISPGEKVLGWAGFIVPENTEPLYFRYSIRGSDEKTIFVSIKP